MEEMRQLKKGSAEGCESQSCEGSLKQEPMSQVKV